MLKFFEKKETRCEFFRNSLILFAIISFSAEELLALRLVNKKSYASVFQYLQELCSQDVAFFTAELCIMLKLFHQAVKNPKKKFLRLSLSLPPNPRDLEQMLFLLSDEFFRSSNISVDSIHLIFWLNDDLQRRR